LKRNFNFKGNQIGGAWFLMLRTIKSLSGLPAGLRSTLYEDGVLMIETKDEQRALLISSKALSLQEKGGI
jgi:hypothetical protein